jgi:hypothetical protein
VWRSFAGLTRLKSHMFDTHDNGNSRLGLGGGGGCCVTFHVWVKSGKLSCQLRGSLGLTVHMARHNYSDVRRKRTQKCFFLFSRIYFGSVELLLPVIHFAPSVLIRSRNLRCEEAKVLTRTVEPLMMMMMVMIHFARPLVPVAAFICRHLDEHIPL